MKFNSDFKYDLHRGQIGENYLANILKGHIEVKTDKRALETGNVFVEYESRNKHSGITTTEAEWYAFVLSNTVIILIKTEDLKSICKKLPKEQRKPGGDSNTSMGVIVPIEKLYNKNENRNT